MYFDIYLNYLIKFILILLFINKINNKIFDQKDMKKNVLKINEYFSE